MKDNNGFTLIELIGVIILLVVIILVVAPTTISTLKNNNNKKFLTFKDNIEIAVENYIVDNDLTSSSSVSVSLEVLLENNYIDEIPKVPTEDPNKENTIPYGLYIKATKVSTGYSYMMCKSDDSCKGFNELSTSSSYEHFINN